MRSIPITFVHRMPFFSLFHAMLGKHHATFLHKKMAWKAWRAMLAGQMGGKGQPSGGNSQCTVSATGDKILWKRGKYVLWERGNTLKKGKCKVSKEKCQIQKLKDCGIIQISNILFLHGIMLIKCQNIAVKGSCKTDLIVMKHWRAGSVW